VHRAVVHADREVDGQLALDLAEPLPCVFGKTDDVSRGIETPLCGLEG